MAKPAARRTPPAGAKGAPKKNTSAQVRRTKGGPKPGSAKPGSARSGSSARRPVAVKPAPLQPTFVWSDVTKPNAADGWRSVCGRIAGAVAIVSGLLLLISDHVAYLTLSGTTVKAPTTALTLLAQLILVLGVIAPGALVLLGRGGAFPLAALIPAGTAAFGSALLVYYETWYLAAHPSNEFYFGRAYLTASIRGDAGHYFALIGQCGLAVMLVLVAISWRALREMERSPLGAARTGAASFALAAGIVGGVGMLFAPAVGVLKTVLNGLTEVPVDVAAPDGPFTSVDLAMIGGVVLAAGVLAGGVTVGLLSSRLAVLGGMAGLTAYFGAATATNFADIARNSTLTAGLRSYCLLVSTALAIGGVIYAARARAVRLGELDSAQANRLGVSEEETQ